ncbi:PASTA domain-containing protein [Ferruginibacter albus]|uniref:PASTA domain-containing protein n=1 Tax=Ferruginibacter albus TaxID=2875540 RepID=UPI001CC3D680|nr:PASTA domain-containing protein [Ferruginibacter albus]UAY53280.1 PASTA domain-containing protein [Ferruginibacter albus]
MFKFITNRPFWVNLLVAIGLVLLLIFAFLQLLDIITKHGEKLIIPDVTHKETAAAIKELESKGFDVQIQDSVYTDTLPKGTVIKQLPYPGATVKVNRTVFLTVNCYTAPMIDMPDLKGKTLDFALDILKKSHLKLADTIYKSDFTYMMIVDQLYHNNKIAAGEKVRWGSGITLIVGAGQKDSSFVVPSLLGMTCAEATALLDSLELIPVLVPDATVGKDTAQAFIVKQNPPHHDELDRPVYIKPGQLMDLWLSKDKVILQDTIIKKTN